MNTLRHCLRIACAAIALTGCQALAPPPHASLVKEMHVEGTRLFYIDQGQGTPVVFVHGAMSDHRTWEPQRQAFAKSHRFIAMDQRYFGLAPWPDNGEKFSTETQVNDLAAFIRGLGVGPVHLVGWSMSGASTLGIALRHPELVRSVFVYEGGSSAATTDPAEAKAVAADRGAMFGPVAAALKAGDVQTAARLAIDAIDDVPNNFERLPKAAQAVVLHNARSLAPMFSNAPTPALSCEQLGQIRRPVAFARGELTRPVFRLATEANARCIPGARLIVARGQRHRWPQTDPAGFNEAVAAFIASNP